jgi:hypothetical protein
MTAAVLGVAAVIQGPLFAVAAFVFWVTNGIAAMDTVDGEPPGPLNGYGVPAALLITGISLFMAGIHAFRRASRWRTQSMALIAVVNAALAAIALVAFVTVDHAADRGVTAGLPLVAAGLAVAGFRAARLPKPG